MRINGRQVFYTKESLDKVYLNADVEISDNEDGIFVERIDRDTCLCFPLENAEEWEQIFHSLETGVSIEDLSRALSSLTPDTKDWINFMTKEGIIE